VAKGSEFGNPKEIKLNIYGGTDEAPGIRQHRDFVDSTTSEVAKNCDTFIERLDELQEGDSKWSQPQRLLAGAIGICSEGGELLGLVKKILFQNKKPDVELRMKLKTELGDVMCNVQQILLAMNWELHEVLTENAKGISNDKDGEKHE
jgi:NTP pyrophosphatase (non-canonical NTP hydrolase)